MTIRAAFLRSIQAYGASPQLRRRTAASEAHRSFGVSPELTASLRSSRRFSGAYGASPEVPYFFSWKVMIAVVSSLERERITLA